jgi:hypothetical protein
MTHLVMVSADFVMVSPSTTLGINSASASERSRTSGDALGYRGPSTSLGMTNTAFAALGMTRV